MSEFRPLQFDDYAAILRRRKWLILSVFLIFSVITPLVVALVPNRYRSETLILVEQQKIPAEYVRSTVQEDLSLYLQTLTDQVLSRTRLQYVIEELELQKDREGVTMDQLIQGLRNDIEIELVRNPGRVGGLGGFKMFYESQSPEVAQSVLREVTALLIEENLRVREQQAVGTTRFLQTELDHARVDLQEQEQRLKEFKITYFGELPQQQATNLALLGQMHTQMSANSNSVNRMEQEKTYLNSLLAARRTVRRQQEEQMQSLLDDGSVPVGSGSDDASTMRFKEMQTRLVNMEGRYTANHPDVVRLRAEIERMRKTLPSKQAEDGAGGENPEVVSQDPEEVQLASRLKSLDMALQNAQREQAELKKKIRRLQGRVNVSPVREQQYTDVTRDHGVAKAQYDSLLQKRNDAEIAANLERRQQGQRFRILDPPSLPASPSEPNRPMLHLAGIGFGLLVGLGFAGLLEIKSASLWSPKDVTYYLNLPTVATIPRIQTPKQGRGVPKQGAGLNVVRG